MSGETIDWDVEALARVLVKHAPAFDEVYRAEARAILSSDWYAERIAQARLEGATEAASAGYHRGYTDCRDGGQFRDPWRPWLDADGGVS